MEDFGLLLLCLPMIVVPLWIGFCSYRNAPPPPPPSEWLMQFPPKERKKIIARNKAMRRSIRHGNS